VKEINMLYRTMPKNGDQLSILGFGCMRLPADEKGVIDQNRAIAQIRYAVDQGVNYLDTAWPYHGGHSEALLGQALKDGYRGRVKLATKLPLWMIKTRQDMDHYLNEQLARLDTDRIDYYLLHALDGDGWDKLAQLGVRAFLDQALADGRIVNAGSSFHGSAEAFPRIVDAYDWTFCQIQYNYLDEQSQAGTAGLKYAAAKQMGVIVMEPLRGGNLGLPEAPPAIQAIWDTAQQQRTPVAWALGWLWDHPEVTVVLSGMNEEAHIEENLAMADSALPNSLTEAEQDIIARAAQTYREIMKVGCTGCGYCMPCPAKVMIPPVFEVYNKMHLFGNEAEARFMYAMRMSGLVVGGETGYASQCVACGQCVEKCPQQLNIPQHLAAVAEELEGPDLDTLAAAAKAMFTGESGQEN
jgi:uncharacterized protein